jgi:signal transduction histidine kinase
VIKYIPSRGISRNLSILAWVILISGTFIYFIQTNFFSDASILNHGFELSLLFFNILFALALANKLSTYKKEKEEAEKLEIKAIAEKEQLIHEQNDILEKLIAERNKELIDKIQKSSFQKLEIEKQNEMINKSIVELDALNNELIKKNEEIQKQNIELEAQHVILERTIKKRTRKLMKARELAITAEKLKTSFLNNLTQEINTPMSAITGYSGLISDKGLDKDKRNEYLTNIINYVEILLDSVDNIVTLSRIQAGIIKHKPGITSQASLYKIIKSQAGDKIAFSGKDIKLDVISENQNTDIFFELDHPKLSQIISILIDITLRQIKTGQISINSCPQESPLEPISGKVKLNIRVKILSFDNSLEQLGTNYFTAMTATEFKYSSQNEMGMAIIKGLSGIIHAKTKLIIIDEQSLLFKIKVPVICVSSKNGDN